MTYGRVAGLMIKYLPFLGILALKIYSLYHGVTTIADEANRNVRIWTDALVICAIVGEVGNLLVIDRFNLLLSGKTPNFAQDVLEDDSQDVSVTYNGMIVSSLFIPALVILYYIYIVTEIQLLLSVVTILAVLWAVCTVTYILAGYLKVKYTFQKSIFSDSDINYSGELGRVCLPQYLQSRKRYFSNAGVNCSTVLFPRSYFLPFLKYLLLDRILGHQTRHR